MRPIAFLLIVMVDLRGWRASGDEGDERRRVDLRRAVRTADAALL